MEILFILDVSTKTYVALMIWLTFFSNEIYSAAIWAFILTG